MTPRDRMAAVLEHRLPDRIPTTIFARGEVQRALMSRFGVASFDDAKRILGADLYADVELAIAFPAFDPRANGTLAGDCPFAGERFIFHDERTFQDAWGVVRRVGGDGKYVEWISGPLADAGSPTGWEVPLADPDSGEPALAAEIRERKARGLFVRAFVPNPYKTAWYLRGMDALLADYAADPAFVEALYDRICPFFADLLARYARLGVDMVAIEGDIAMQDRIIVGPARWRRIDKPRLAAMIEAAKRQNPAVAVFFHSDGNLMDVMDDLVEIGFTVIDSLQPECMDPVQVKRRWGSRIVLHGCGSLQRVMPFGTAEECRAEVRYLIESCGYDGGLVLRPSNMIGWDVPLDNIVAWYDEAMRYDLSRVGRTGERRPQW
jgi:uroporphyrinogen decarboxylase